MGYLVQMAGLAVQNFVSAAVGIAVCFALIRGFARAGTSNLGNFWVDLTRICLRLLLPVCGRRRDHLRRSRDGAEPLPRHRDITTLAGNSQHVTGGPVASQEVIKELGTNGGGFYNANSSHPFENPTAWTNWIQVFLLLAIPFSLPRVWAARLVIFDRGTRSWPSW